VLWWIVDGVLGALLGAGFLWLAHRAGRGEDALVALGLVVAAVLYPVMGISVHALTEMPIELTGMGAFTALALLGASRSPAWLVAGWGAHAVWDLALPAVADTAYVPVWYAAACLGFDVAVASGVALGIRGRVRRPDAGAPAQTTP